MKALHLCDNTRIEAVSALCHRYGTGIEVQSFFDPSHLPSHPDTLEVHRKALAAILSRSFHGPFAELNAGSFDPMIREVARFRFNEAIAQAQQFDITHLILHHGYFPNTSPPDRWRERFCRFWREFFADKPDALRIHLENVFDSGPELIAQVIDTIADPRVDICLDLGHVNCFTKGDCVAWIKYLNARIGYVHMHDNNGLKDEHLGIGRGTIPFAKVCEALNEHAPDAVWALECEIDHMTDSVDWLRKHRFI